MKSWLEIEIVFRKHYLGRAVTFFLFVSSARPYTTKKFLSFPTTGITFYTGPLLIFTSKNSNDWGGDRQWWASGEGELQLIFSLFKLKMTVIFLFSIFNLKKRLAVATGEENHGR